MSGVSLRAGHHGKVPVPLPALAASRRRTELEVLGALARRAAFTPPGVSLYPRPAVQTAAEIVNNRDEPAGGAPGAGARELNLPAPLRALLRVPLFYKILIANAAIVILGTVAGTAATLEFVRAEPGQSPLWLAGALALLGVVATVLVNAFILRLALSPLKLLEETAACVQRGELDARAPLSRIGDPELDRLIRTFNGMLDTLATYRQRLRDVAARALNAEEEERKRIARELHDETAQLLAALLIRVRLARGADDPLARQKLFEEMRDQITVALEGVRRFARGLRPPALDELGLVVALESHARGLHESVGLAVEVDADPLDGLLTPQAELALYRIVQEALSNVIRHAAATHAHVRLTHADGVVTATVEDDGRGFPVRRVMSGSGNRGLGLFGMQERASYVGGQVEIQSREGHGTRVLATVPVAEEPVRSAEHPEDR
jgi:two-component system sensor histidine kinase UhpB